MHTNVSRGRLSILLDSRLYWFLNKDFYPKTIESLRKRGGGLTWDILMYRYWPFGTGLCPLDRFCPDNLLSGSAQLLLFSSLVWDTFQVSDDIRFGVAFPMGAIATFGTDSMNVVMISHLGSEKLPRGQLAHIFMSFRLDSLQERYNSTCLIIQLLFFFHSLELLYIAYLNSIA